MTVHCPHCGTGYLLPDHLLGPRGARVRCPNCRRPFVVLREEGASVSSTNPGESSAAEGQTLPVESSAAVASEPVAQSAQGLSEVTSAASEPTPTNAAESVAKEILESLADRVGERLAEARSRGRVLAELGPELMKAYDDFRARAGAEAPREAFRAVLRERWGVDLL